jgi:hypothetical protein
VSDALNMPSALTTASINPNSPRFAEWNQVFGSDRIPICGPFVRVGRAPGLARAEFYRLDISRLTGAQIDNLVRHLSRKFEIPEAEVVIGIIGEHGVPILADDVVVTMEGPWFL